MTTASPGALWMQAYTETKDLPSFQRQAKVRERYLELLRESGLLRRAEPGEERRLPCGKPYGNRAARKGVLEG